MGTAGARHPNAKNLGCRDLDDFDILPTKQVDADLIAIVEGIPERLLEAGDIGYPMDREGAGRFLLDPEEDDTPIGVGHCRVGLEKAAGQGAASIPPAGLLRFKIPALGKIEDIKGAQLFHGANLPHHRARLIQPDPSGQQVVHQPLLELLEFVTIRLFGQ